MIHRILSIETGKSIIIIMVASYKSWYLITLFKDIMLLFINNICNREQMLSVINPFVVLCLIQKNLLMDSFCLKTRFWGTYFQHFTCQNISYVDIFMLLLFIAGCVWRQVDIPTGVNDYILHALILDICFMEDAISSLYHWKCAVVDLRILKFSQ